MGGLVWKVLGTGSAVLGGIVAGKLVDQIWSRAGQDPSIDPKDPEVPVGQAVAYAVLTAVTATAIKTMLTRKAANYYKDSAGHLPKAMTPDQAKALGIKA